MKKRSYETKNVGYLNGEKTGNSTLLEGVNELGRKTEFGNVEFVLADGNRNMANLVISSVIETKTLESLLRGEDGSSIGGGNSRNNERNGGSFFEVRSETEKGVETESVMK
jgi:hypothetical protein